MDTVELHALEKSQLPSHITTPTQLPEDHTKPQVTLLPLTQPPLLSQTTLPELLPEVLLEVFHQPHLDHSEETDSSNVQTDNNI
jgi:hypothetical protein